MRLPKMEQESSVDGLESYCLEYKDWDGHVYIFEQETYSLCGIVSRFKSQMGWRYDNDRILGVSVYRNGKSVELWNS